MRADNRPLHLPKCRTLGVERMVIFIPSGPPRFCMALLDLGMHAIFTPVITEAGLKFGFKVEAIIPGETRSQISWGVVVSDFAQYIKDLDQHEWNKIRRRLVRDGLSAVRRAETVEKIAAQRKAAATILRNEAIIVADTIDWMDRRKKSK